MVGGAGVMRIQLARLAEVSEYSPDITIQVLPFSAGAHAASGTGPLTILQFTAVPGLGMVRLHGQHGGVCLTDPAAIARYLQVFTSLRGSAMTAAESSRMLRDAAEDRSLLPG
jgi:Domain of unknown function (DUF5753)